MNTFMVIALFVAGVTARPSVQEINQQGIPGGSYLPGIHQTEITGGVSNTRYNINPYQYTNYFDHQMNQGVSRHQSFFFDSPDDLGETHVRIHVQPSAAAGDKSIYIRAPAYNSKIVSHVNLPQQQSTGKTKVYVLVKKQEEQQQDIVVPSAAQGPAAQPEVIFVKYSSQKEAEQKLNDIQRGGSEGNRAKTVYNTNELITSIKDQLTKHPEHTSVSKTIISTGDVTYGPAGESGPY